jgi:putative transposase
MKRQASQTDGTVRGGLRLVEERSLLERLGGSVEEQLGLFAERMREGLLAASVAVGLEVMGELIEAEVAAIAGPKGKHDAARRCYRHGSEDGRVTLGGRRVPVRRPRVRSIAEGDGSGREVQLESYETFASVDLLAERMFGSMLAGLSGRRYEHVLEPVGERVAEKASGTSQSSVSRRFITATRERLEQFRSRSLEGERWLIVFVDGFDFAGHTMVGALGVTANGTKVPLGVVQGSTENAAVVGGLVRDLRDRGLDASEGVLFVVDGGKALSKAIGDVFGSQALIARCRLHKERNVLDHLPERERPWVRRKLRAAWANPDADEAEQALEALARQLAKINPDAAGSLREGLAETLTVTRLGITGTLLKTVTTTNPVESMIEIVRDHARNVKHWQGDDMRLRWAAAGMEAAATQFRRVKGYQQLPLLTAALHQAVKTDNTQEIAVSA